MDLRPVGIFDSGMGGLTAVRELRRLLPAEDIIYLGDTARVPYGGRSVAELEDIALSDVRFLLSRVVKAILVACGTVSSNCMGLVMGAAGVPASGVVVPAAREAVNCTRSGRIGVLATLATARSGAFEREIAAMAPDASVLSSGTAELVPLVEAGRTSLDDDGVRAALTGCLAPFTGGAVDTLILGCTHYPLLGAAIAGLLGPEVRLIDAGAAGARETACLLREGGLDCRARRIGGLSLCTTGAPGPFESLAALFLGGERVPRARHVEL